ncbi:hypothetical protein Ciccas_004238 [Cichlidogyrus casuarinus]|uniref:Uncharacterized protein n=1 Tax=Cichlidogyrus casuarinus TaxID=1844966 RepID=A0ABD2QC60_9PLAT
MISALVTIGVNGDICTEENFSLRKECSTVGVEVDTNVDMDQLRKVTLLDQTAKRISKNCDRMQFCIKYIQILSIVRLSNMLASWQNQTLRSMICSNLSCFDKLMLANSCLLPVSTTNGDVGESADPIDFSCLANALALAQYAAAEAQRVKDVQLGLHADQCGQQSCPGPDCPETCLNIARKYACLRLRCQDRADDVDNFFAWMMGDNKLFLPSMSTPSVKNCARELPLMLAVTSVIDKQVEVRHQQVYANLKAATRLTTRDNSNELV